MKLGCLPSAPDDLKRRLWLHKYLAKAPSPPAQVDYTSIGEPWGELGNDTLNDCTVAAAGHAIQLTEYYGRHRPSGITASQVVAAYSALTGYDPGGPRSAPA